MSMKCKNCGHRVEIDYLFEEKQLKRFKWADIVRCPNCPPPREHENIPQGVTVSSSDEELIVSFRIFTGLAVFLCSVMIFMALAVFAMLLPSMWDSVLDLKDRENIIELLLLLGLLLPALYYIYMLLVNIKNRIVITIKKEPGSFRLRFTPLPWTGNRYINLRERPKLIVVEYTSHRYPNLFCFYFIDYNEKIHKAFELADNQKYTAFIKDVVSGYLAPKGE